MSDENLLIKLKSNKQNSVLNFLICVKKLKYQSFIYKEDKV